MESKWTRRRRRVGIIDDLKEGNSYETLNSYETITRPIELAEGVPKGVLVPAPCPGTGQGGSEITDFRFTRQIECEKRT